MSYTEFLRTKMASQRKVLNVQNTTDASSFTTKTRMQATQTFFADGTSKGTLGISTDRPTNNHQAVSTKKNSSRPPDASVYTAYRGGQGISQDLPYRTGGKKIVDCVLPPDMTETWKYSSASDHMRSVKCNDTLTNIPDAPGDSKFVDNTISLSAMHPSKLAGCINNFNIENPNHTHSPGIDVDCGRLSRVVEKPFFMQSPPMPQGPNVSSHKVGSYYTPLSGYVENKHGYVQPTRPTSVAPGGQGQQVAQLKINRPTLFNIKPV